jgi:hypothetical protein
MLSWVALPAGKGFWFCQKGNGRTVSWFPFSPHRVAALPRILVLALATWMWCASASADLVVDDFTVGNAFDLTYSTGQSVIQDGLSTAHVLDGQRSILLPTISSGSATAEFDPSGVPFQFDMLSGSAGGGNLWLIYRNQTDLSVFANEYVRVTVTNLDAGLAKGSTDHRMSLDMNVGILSRNPVTNVISASNTKVAVLNSSQPQYVFVPLGPLLSSNANPHNIYELRVDFDYVIQDVSLGVSDIRIVSPRTQLPGDFSGDGFVDAADYALWRGRVGMPSIGFANDTIGGIVGQPHYAAWRANFGNSSGSVAAQSAVVVPAPQAGQLVAGVVVLMLLCRPCCARKATAFCGSTVRS